MDYFFARSNAHLVHSNNAQILDMFSQLYLQNNRVLNELVRDITNTNESFEQSIKPKLILTSPTDVFALMNLKSRGTVSYCDAKNCPPTIEQSLRSKSIKFHDDDLPCYEYDSERMMKVYPIVQNIHVSWPYSRFSAEAFIQAALNLIPYERCPHYLLMSGAYISGYIGSFPISIKKVTNVLGFMLLNKQSVTLSSQMNVLEDSDIAGIIIQVIYALMCIGKAFHCMHGNLELYNILLMKNPYNYIEYRIGDQRIAFPCKYIAVLNDFSFGKICNLNVFALDNKFEFDYGTDMGPSNDVFSKKVVDYIHIPYMKYYDPEEKKLVKHSYICAYEYIKTSIYYDPFSDLDKFLTKLAFVSQHKLIPVVRSMISDIKNVYMKKDMTFFKEYYSHERLTEVLLDKRFRHDVSEKQERLIINGY